MSTLLRCFDLYVKLNLKTIPLHPFSKIPINTCWNKKWNLKYNRKFFELNDNLNIGLLLGEVVDVEGDSEIANKFLLELIGDTPHPMWKSSKSIHHLFINPDNSLTALKCMDIEFRGYKHQSVLPPSKHSDGTEYNWLDHSKWHVPPMPNLLLNFYKKNRKTPPRPKPRPIEPGKCKSICQYCNQPEFIHKSRLKLEVQAFKTFNLKWQCHKCRKVDIRELCREIRG